MKLKTPYTEQDLIMENINMTESDYMDTSDTTVTLTCKEHELLNDILLATIDSICSLFPSGWRELPEDSELRHRAQEIENIQEKFSQSWSERFD
jgi:hypothetical protein